MNKRLEDAITRLKSQPEERQQEAAEILFDFLEQGAVPNEGSFQGKGA
jgi:hypothetical protein